jgi:UDP-glucose 4-epimerase
MSCFTSPPAVGVKLIVEQPVHTIETNVHGTEVVLKHANKKKKLVVVASTSEVYGKSEDVPFREDSDLVLGPTPKHRWAYACSKAIDEFLALAYWKERKLPVIIVRFFNTVGPRPDRPVRHGDPNFVRQALAGEPITVFGDGTQNTLVHARSPDVFVNAPGSSSSPSRGRSSLLLQVINLGKYR